MRGGRRKEEGGRRKEEGGGAGGGGGVRERVCVCVIEGPTRGVRVLGKGNSDWNTTSVQRNSGVRGPEGLVFRLSN